MTGDKLALQHKNRNGVSDRLPNSFYLPNIIPSWCSVSEVIAEAPSEDSPTVGLLTRRRDKHSYPQTFGQCSARECTYA